jgi:hypothetical protein
MRLNLVGLREKPPFIVCDVDDPIAVEDAIGLLGFTVGMNWSCSGAEQEQPDGQWTLYVSRREYKLPRRQGL